MNEQLVSIQSVPRSGSSWLGQIFRSSPRVAYRFQPLFSYAFKGRLNGSSTREEIVRFFQDIKRTEDDFVLQKVGHIHVEYPSWAESPDTSHIVMKEVRYNHIVRRMVEQVPGLKVVGLVRHPCAVIDSWIHAPREFRPEWNVDEEWRSGASKNQNRPEEFFGFDKWKEVAQLFLDLEREHPSQVKVVRYADLNADPIEVVRDVFAFCALDLGPETVAFIEQSRSRQGEDANSIYRLERPDTAWRDRLPASIARTIQDELSGGPLSRFL
ncbi:MAG: sulfotransferase [Flavobacteriales bacterium]|nr:sulfotransferase [Flavobacteriales bacterium]